MTSWSYTTGSWKAPSDRSSLGNRFLYTGREWIAEIGLYDYRHRFYNPGLGRFLQTDPLGLQTEGEKLSVGQKALFSPGGQAPEAFGSSEMNLFRYCGDDPVDGSDPLGLDKVEVTFDKTSKPQVGPLHTDPSGHVHSGQFVWRDDNGKIRFNIPVNSGGYKTGDSHNKSEETRVFAGKYKATEDLGNRADPRMSRDGVGFSIKLAPAFKQDPNNYQTLLRIHPDGGYPGTHACLGLCADGKTLTAFRKAFNDYVGARGPLPVDVK